MKTVAVVDGMGGGMGAQIVAQIRKEFIDNINILALGTNAIATDKMIQAKANKGASGENAIKVSINSADFIIGPIGIILPNAMMGEITSEIACAIMNAPGNKILLPINQPHITLVGLKNDSLGNLLKIVIEELKNAIQ